MLGKPVPRQYGDYAVADAEQLPLPPDSFDGVVALDCWTNLSDLRRYWLNKSRLAAGAPFIFIFYPNANGVPSILRRTARRYLSQTTSPSSTRLMSLPALHRLLVQSGFCVDNAALSRTVTGAGFRWSAWQNRWLEAVAVAMFSAE